MQAQSSKERRSREQRDPPEAITDEEVASKITNYERVIKEL